MYMPTGLVSQHRPNVMSSLDNSCHKRTALRTSTHVYARNVGYTLRIARIFDLCTHGSIIIRPPCFGVTENAGLENNGLNIDNDNV